MAGPVEVTQLLLHAQVSKSAILQYPLVHTYQVCSHRAVSELCAVVAAYLQCAASYLLLALLWCKVYGKYRFLPVDVYYGMQDPDTNVRTQAEARLKEFQDQNYPGFLASLAAELTSTAKPPDSRRLSGIVLKNALDAKDDARKAELQARWGAVDSNLKNQIKEALLNTLQMEPQDVRHIAALVIAKVAAIDLPRGEWPQLISTLLANMSASPPQHGVRQATLEALGYVCEEMAALDDEVLAPDQVNMILTAVVAGMRPDEPSAETRLAATVALQNAIDFADHNFDNEQERTYIMQVKWVKS